MNEPVGTAGTSTVPSFEGLRAAVQAGSGIVARFPGLVLSAAAEGVGVEQLLDICREVTAVRSRAPGKVVARRLAGWLAQLDEVPDFGVIAATDDALAVFLCGRATVLLPGERALSGTEAAAWVDRLLPWPAESFMLTLGGTGLAQLAPFLDLRQGVVPGAGLLLTPQAALPVVAAPAQPRVALTEQPDAVPADPLATATALPPVGEAAVAKGVCAPSEESSRPVLEPPARAEKISGVAPDEPPRKPLPAATGPSEIAGPAQPTPEGVLADGFLCSRGHLNDPRTHFCASCGIRMAERTGVVVRGVRPPLGLLVFDDGASFVLDDDYLLGRRPDVDERVRDGSMRPLVIDDHRGLVSRVHLEIQLRGWDVYLNDTGSVNGTLVATPEARTWSALVPGHPLRLPPGTRVNIGSRSFVFESSLAR